MSQIKKLRCFFFGHRYFLRLIPGVDHYSAAYVECVICEKRRYLSKALAAFDKRRFEERKT